MNKALLPLAAACCLVAAGTLCLLRFAWDTPSDLPAAAGECREGVVSSEDLQTRLEGIRRRSQAKYEVVCELLAGRLTLLEAAARFRSIDAGFPEARARLVHGFPGVP